MAVSLGLKAKYLALALASVQDLGLGVQGLGLPPPLASGTLLTVKILSVEI